MWIYFLFGYLIIGALHHYIFYLIDKHANILEEVNPMVRFAAALFWIIVDAIFILAIVKLYINNKKEKIK